MEELKASVGEPTVDQVVRHIATLEMLRSMQAYESAIAIKDGNPIARIPNPLVRLVRTALRQ